MLMADCDDRRWDDFATGVELNQPSERGIDERMVGRAASEEKISVGRQVEAARLAVAFGKLNQELAAVFVAEAFEHLIDLRGPGSVALRSFEQLLQISAASGEAAKIVEILHRQIGLLATSFGAASERDAAENAAGVRRRACCRSMISFGVFLEADVCSVKRIVRAGAAKSASDAPSQGEKWAGSIDSSPRVPGGVRP